MVTREKLDIDKFGKDILEDRCPYCGEPLLSRHARRMHLTLKSCQGGAGIFPGDLIDRREPEVHREPTPEEIAAMAERFKDRK